jgi:hypothetical protein
MKFAHLPRAKDEPQQVRAFLDAVGADWEFLGRYEHADDLALHNIDGGGANRVLPSEVEFHLGQVLEVHNTHGGSIGVATVTGIAGSCATGLEVTAKFEPWHDFSDYEPKIATEPEPDLGPTGGGNPARGHRFIRKGRLG